MHWLYVFLLALTQSPGASVPSSPLEIQVINATTGAPIPHADVLWLDAITDLEHRHRSDPDWPTNQLLAVQNFGHAARCDGERRVILEAPLGGTYIAVEFEGLFAFQVVPSGPRPPPMPLSEPSLPMLSIDCSAKGLSPPKVLRGTTCA